MSYITMPATYSNWKIIPEWEVKGKPTRVIITFEYKELKEENPNLNYLLEEARDSKKFDNHEDLMNELMS